MFKKRESKKTNLRKRDADEVEDDADEAEGAIALKPIDIVKDIRAEQDFRKRKTGVPVASLSSKVNSHIVDDIVSKNIKSKLNSQFAIQDQSSASSLSHEAIMEQYIKQKIGLPTDDESQNLKKEITEEDKLYMIPDDIKALPSTGSNANETEVKELPGAIGIAEVALPIQFKVRNIEETENARKIMMNGGMNSRAHSSALAPSIMREFQSQSGGTGGRHEHPQSMRQSTDDVTLFKFIRKERDRMKRR